MSQPQPPRAFNDANAYEGYVYESTQPQQQEPQQQQVQQQSTQTSEISFMQQHNTELLQSTQKDQECKPHPLSNNNDQSITSLVDNAWSSATEAAKDVGSTIASMF